MAARYPHAGTSLWLGPCTALHRHWPGMAVRGLGHARPPAAAAAPPRPARQSGMK